MRVRLLSGVLIATALSACVTVNTDLASAPALRSDGLLTAAPAVQQDQLALLRALVEKAAAGDWGSVDSLLVMKDGKLVVERYFRNNQWDRPHDLKSVSKSLLSAAYGAAISHKLIKDVNQPIYSLFEQASHFANPHPDKHLMTAAHVMSMTSGLGCGGMTAATNPCGQRLYEPPMSWGSKLRTPPWQRALNIPLTDRPGTKFVYNDAAPVIIDALLSGIVGVDSNAFLKLTLFKPMQFNSRSSLHALTARDMAKFGQLYLDGGVWQGKRLLSKSWVDDSTSAKWSFKENEGSGYGYFWWIAEHEIAGHREKYFYAMGHGGQAIFVLPSHSLVFVTTAANYDSTDAHTFPNQMLRQYVVPAFIF